MGLAVGTMIGPTMTPGWHHIALPRIGGRSGGFGRNAPQCGKSRRGASPAPSNLPFPSKLWVAHPTRFAALAGSAKALYMSRAFGYRLNIRAGLRLARH